MYVCKWAYWTSFFPVCCSIHLRSWSAQVAMATACVQCTPYRGLSLSVSLCFSPLLFLFLSGVFALPFTQRHLLPLGLTRQKQQMQIMLTAMLINAKTPEAWLSIANGPQGFARKQLNSLNCCLILWIHSVLLVSLYSDLTVNITVLIFLLHSFNVCKNLFHNSVSYVNEGLVVPMALEL